MKVIISGGGSGGHIFPAIAIANAIKKEFPDTLILFVGAEGKMEMEKVPAAGYKIVGLPMVGIQRKMTLKNLAVPFKVFRSLQKAGKILKEFAPDIVIGVGGYASAAVLWKATSQGIPALIQEQNSYPGITNKILSRRVATICVAYPGMEKFFNKEKIVFTGNPVRHDIVNLVANRETALEFFGLNAEQPVLLSVGGSLGARTMNESIHSALQYFKEKQIQVIWQTGKFYYQAACNAVKAAEADNVKVFEFLSKMDYAYTAADVIVSRAGAIAISELCLVGKPAILVPSPNVSEDHQTKNAMALVKRNAALLLPDTQAVEKLPEMLENLFNDKNLQQELSLNAKQLGVADAAERIVEEVVKLMKK